MCPQIFNNKSYSASLLLRDPLHINLYFRDHDTKIILVFYTCNLLNLIIRTRQSFTTTAIIRDNYLYQHMTMTSGAYEKNSLSPTVFKLLLNFPEMVLHKGSVKINPLL